MKWYLQAFKNTFDFKGRARRSEYWYLFLFNMVVFIGLMSLAVSFDNLNRYKIDAIENFFTILIGLYGLITIIPNLSVSIRRLHDVGRSGFWLAICLIPYVGFITILILAAQDSEQGTNKWGSNPKETEQDDIMDHLVDDFD